MFADSHCHLADEAFAHDLEAVVERAQAAGLSRALCVLDAGSDEEAARAARLSRLWPAVRFSVGVHPHQAAAYALRPEAAVEVVERALKARPDASAVGEGGLDYHYDFAPPDVQRETLAVQVGLAASRGLPLVIHAREAEGEVVDVIRQAGEGRVRGVFHYYTGDVATVRRVLDLGFSVGFGGIVTQKRIKIEAVDTANIAIVRLKGKMKRKRWSVIR